MQVLAEHFIKVVAAVKSLFSAVLNLALSSIYRRSSKHG